MLTKRTRGVRSTCVRAGSADETRSVSSASVMVGHAHAPLSTPPDTDSLSLSRQPPVTAEGSGATWQWRQTRQQTRRWTRRGGEALTLRAHVTQTILGAALASAPVARAAAAVSTNASTK